MAAGAGWRRAVAARPDATIAVLLAAASLLYLAAQPYNLGLFDEAVFLFEAKRVARGEVMYRDLYQIFAPASHWFMAIMFWLFGISIRTARIVMAVVQTGVVVLVFAACRRAGVRPALAALAALAHLALCQAVWPYASPHWFATLCMVWVLFLVVVPGRSAAPPRAALRPGIAVGTLAVVLQHQGAAFAVAVLALYLLDHLLGRRYGDARPWRDLGARVVCFGAGIALIVVPVAGYLLATAEWRALWSQLVVHPLTGYRTVNHARWGQVLLLTGGFAEYTYPRLLAGLPVVAGIGGLRGARLWLARADRARFDALLALLTMCGGGALAVSYLPDVIHLAFIAPLFLVFAAETAEAALRAVGRRRARERWVAAGLALALAAGLAVQMARNLERMRRTYPFVHETAFGPVAFSGEREIRLVDTVRRLLAQTPTRELFAYPAYGSIYLNADADNISPHPLFAPGYNTPEQIAELIQLLETKKPPYVLVIELFVRRETDPVLQYLFAHYDCYDWGDHSCGLLRRRD